MTIRQATSADLDGIVASASALFAEDAGTRDPHTNTAWPEEHGHDYYGAAIGDFDVLCLVAESGDQIVGHLIGRLREPNPTRPLVVSAVLESVRVAEDHRGTGLGGALLDAFAAWSRRRGVTEATVSAYASNTAAIAFYQARGYAPVSVQLGLELG